MMKRILLLMLGIVCFSFSFAQKDSVRSTGSRSASTDSPRKKIDFTYWDYLHYYPSVRDTDSTNYVLIQNFIITKASQSKIDSTKYPQGNYNYTKVKQTQKKYFDNNNYILRKPNSNWLPLLILFTLIYYVILRRVFAKNFPIIFQSYWNDRLVQQLARDDNFFKMRAAISLFVLYCLILSLFLYNVSDYFNLLTQYTGLKKYFFLLYVVIIFYVLKYLLVKLVGYVFSFQRLMTAHLSIISVSNLVFILFSAPFLIFYQFLPDGMLLYIIIFLAVLFLFNVLYKYIRSLVFAVSNFQFSKFYLFIYLCTLEIVPLLLVIKLILIR
jgi:hypothetical protein